jgi:hypothetical protein
MSASPKSPPSITARVFFASRITPQLPRDDSAPCIKYETKSDIARPFFETVGWLVSTQFGV